MHCFLALEACLLMCGAAWASSPRSWLQTFSHYIITRQCHCAKGSSALKIALSFSFPFFSFFPLKRKRKKSKTCRTVSGSHVGVDQTSSQSKTRFISLHSTLPMESDLPSTRPPRAWKGAAWSRDTWLWCSSFSTLELVLNDLHCCLPASCHWHGKPFQIISQNRKSQDITKFLILCV